MTSLPWHTEGAKLSMPRDLYAAYLVGRMGTVTSVDISPLFWPSPRRARSSFLRLTTLRIVRTFPRRDPSHPAWYALTKRAAEWVAEEMDCSPSELRTVSGIARMNKEAVRLRNRFWVSLVLGCREREEAELLLVRPEWELRALKQRDVSIVPDAQIALGIEDEDGLAEYAWFLEFDAGTERLAVWEAKAKTYRALRGVPLLYGAAHWQVLALVPSARRARTVAAAAARGGAGRFLFVGVTEEFENGRALASPFWRAAELAGDPKAPARWTLLGERRGSPQGEPERELDHQDNVILASKSGGTR